MIVLGLTGSIGMGKSTVGAMFAEEGVPVFDADAVVHRLQGRKGALVAEIETLFPGTTGAAGVNRRSEEHTSELQSLMRISYAVFCLKKKTLNTARQLDLITYEDA